MRFTEVEIAFGKQDGEAMGLQEISSVNLPEHIAPGGFDHAAYHPGNQRMYVAHTANNALDVIDCATEQYLGSIPDLTGIAGALASAEKDLVFTSNRGEDTVGIFSPDQEQGLIKIRVGSYPNGLAFDPRRGHLLAANVGDPMLPGSFTLSIVDVAKKKMLTPIPVAGRTRWAIYSPKDDAFYVNIAHPAQIVVVEGGEADKVMRTIPISAAGPHGLDQDPETGRLFCACDEGALVCLEAQSGEATGWLPLSGTPDVIFYNAALNHLYVAVGDPGVIDVIDTKEMQLIQTIDTEKRAHTLGFIPDQNKVYAFLPQTHRALVFQDREA
jgi:DNA-binding beta-propeller fold protein YncE